MKRKASLALLSLLSVTSFTVIPSAQAGDHHGFRSQHPVASSALLGGGIGALTGGLVSPRERRTHGIVKGALIGAGAGGAYGLLTNSGRSRGHGHRRNRGHGHH